MTVQHINDDHAERASNVSTAASRQAAATMPGGETDEWRWARQSVTHRQTTPDWLADGHQGLLTIPQAAEVLNVGERFIRRLVSERRIVFRKVGRHVRFRPTDLDDYIESVKREPPTPQRGSRQRSTRRR